MRKEERETKIVTEEKEIVKKKYVICNKCGKEFNNIPKDEDDWYTEYFWDGEVQNFSASFGYGSKFDNENWSFDLCEECLLNLIKTFKYCPDGFREDGYLVCGDRKDIVFSHWKETNEWDDFYGAPYEEIIEWKDAFRTDYLNDQIQKHYPNKPLIQE